MDQKTKYSNKGPIEAKCYLATVRCAGRFEFVWLLGAGIPGVYPICPRCTRNEMNFKVEEGDEELRGGF